MFRLYGRVTCHLYFHGIKFAKKWKSRFIRSSKSHVYAFCGIIVCCKRAPLLSDLYKTFGSDKYRAERRKYYICRIPALYQKTSDTDFCRIHLAKVKTKSGACKLNLAAYIDFMHMDL